MQHKPLLLAVAAAIFICSAVFAETVAEEKITLSTYYPAPYGVYERLFVSGEITGDVLDTEIGPALGIDSTLTASADSQQLTALHINPTFNDATFSTNHNGLIVENGNVGIGTTEPVMKLEVEGGAIKLLDASDYPYGIVIDRSAGSAGGWAREYKFTSGGTGTLFALGALFSGDNLSYGYIGGNTASTTAYSTSDAWMFFDPEGNVGIGTRYPGGNPITGEKVFSIANGTQPSIAIATQASLYCTGGELHAIDGAGNDTPISPHDQKTGEWIFYSKNINTGRTVKVNMEKLVKAVEELTGKEFMIETWED